MTAEDDIELPPPPESTKQATIGQKLSVTLGIDAWRQTESVGGSRFAQAVALAWTLSCPASAALAERRRKLPDDSPHDDWKAYFSDVTLGALVVNSLLTTGPVGAFLTGTIGRILARKVFSK